MKYITIKFPKFAKIFLHPANFHVKIILFQLVFIQFQPFVHQNVLFPITYFYFRSHLSIQRKRAEPVM